ncbi:MAG: fimbrillin family protein [Muribaculaceae bacterium]|nr:fimbrillin family protein [Muribaculaceae bacterium]
MGIIYSKQSIYIFLSVLAVCVTSSCASDPIVNEEGERVELSFATSGATRASVTADINTEGARFAVCGDMLKAESGNSDSKRVVIFNNTEVEYDGANWSYGETRYWLPNYEYSFVAIHPASLISEATVTDSQYSGSKLSFRYTIPMLEGDRINRVELSDIIAATHRRKYNDDGYLSASPVNLNFFHTLSRINFLLEYEGQAETVTITKIELEGVDKTATFTLVPAPLLDSGIRTDDYALSWSDLSDRGTLIADINTDVSTGETQSLCPDNDALFMIPQPDNNGIIMKISYVYDRSDDSEEQTLTAQTPIGGWEAGKIYSYFITLNIVEEKVNMIFDVNVTDWKEGASTDISVPRK